MGSEDKTTTANSTYPKLAVQWLNEAFPLRRNKSCFVSSSVVADSSVLRNRQLLVAAIHIANLMKTTRQTFTLFLIVTTFSCHSSKNGMTKEYSIEDPFRKQHYDAYSNALKTWQYFLPKDIISVKVIDYQPTTIRCGRVTQNAMAIAIDSLGDTIRIIEFCPDPKSISLNQFYQLYPDKEIPEDKNPNIAYIDPYPDKFVCKYPSVIRTTYGRLRK